MVTSPNGSVIAERWQGDPPTVMALHGWGRTHRDWHPSLGSLPTVAVDLPGFGMSPPPATPQGSQWYADEVTPLLEKYGPLVLVGHSFGGRVAAHVAAQHPELVRGVVLTGAPLVRTAPPPKPSLSVRIAKTLTTRGLLPTSLADKLKQRHGSPDYRAAQGVMRDVLVTVLHENYDAPLKAIQCPVHLVWGQHDTAAPIACAQAIAALIPNAELTVVPGEGHNLSGPLGDHIRSAVDALIPTPDPS